MTTDTPRADIEAMSYEQARAELVDVVQRLEQGAATLEDSLALWERGEALATRCQSWLDAARERLRAASEAGRNETSRTEPNRTTGSEGRSGLAVTREDEQL